MHYARVIHGYHGCDATVAQQLLEGGSFAPSENDYDWLGRGVYLWEYGPDRALRFAQEKQRRGKVQTPAVVGVVVQLGRCFDLFDTRFTVALAGAHEAWSAPLRARGVPLPVNAGPAPDYRLRRLDCAVLNWYLDKLAASGVVYDTVRGGFVEGNPVFEGSGIAQETHIQIAVRNQDCIVGVFRPRLERRLP